MGVEKLIIVTSNDIMGKNILFLRGQRGISREDFGEMIGVEELELRDIELGDIFEIDSDALIRLCEILEVDMNKLISEPMYHKV